MERISIKNELTDIQPTENIFNDSCMIIETAQSAAYTVVNTVLVQRN